MNHRIYCNLSTIVAKLVEIMKTSKKVISLGMVILLSTFIISTTTTQAKPDRIEINFEYHWYDYTPPKKEWTTDKGVLHTLQTPHFGIVDSGDITGELYYCGNLILDLNTYNGKGGGYFEFTGEYEGDSAGFWGIMYFDIEALVLTGTVNLHGTGAFEGMLIKGTVYTILFVLPTTSVSLVVWNR